MHTSTFLSYKSFSITVSFYQCKLCLFAKGITDTTRLSLLNARRQLNLRADGRRRNDKVSL